MLPSWRTHGGGIHLRRALAMFEFSSAAEDGNSSLVEPPIAITVPVGADVRLFGGCGLGRIGWTLIRRELG